MSALRKVEQIVTHVLFDEPANKHTSMGVGGKLACMAFPRNEAELRALLNFASREEIACYAVGNWTNIIVADEGWDGVAISMKNMDCLDVKSVGDGFYEITAGAGAMLKDVVALCASKAISGVDFLAGIPGTIGGAVKMNAGAFGREVKDIIASVRLMDKNGDLADIPASNLSFAYRDFSLDPYVTITAATFNLPVGNAEEIRAAMKEKQQMRKDKHPLEFRSAGSVFKNPKGLAAGKIIEGVGLKGKAIGGAQVSEKHANFIVNTSNATATDVRLLIELVCREVLEKEGIALEMEVKMLGFQRC